MKCVKHPDSGLKFKGSQIPLWKEAVKAVIVLKKDTNIYIVDENLKKVKNYLIIYY